ncbi:MAG TPA: adenylate/guanylate cyclase domain-containing protein [Candidatus Binatia bacterium]|nr:adenylate/guanylate cyclase domain-containing protein [Candidatus Binatia bacterium]
MSGQAAVLFADVASSAQLHVQLGDSAAQSTVARVIELLAKAAREARGTVVRTLGDEIMCRFGSADDAVDAAIGMQRGVQAARVATGAGERAGVRIGLHWGEVAGAEAALGGPAVQVAARIASAARRDQVLTSEATVAALGPARRERTRAHERLALRGIGGEVQLHLVEWEDTVTVRAARLRLKVAGRERVIGEADVPLTLGRAPECGFVVPSSYASRLHARLLVRRGRFVLLDESTNGTYLLPDGEASGQELFVRREERALPDAGVLSLGQSCAEEDAVLIRFETAA